MIGLLFRFFHNPGRWVPFTLVYLVLFAWSFFSVIAIADEYEGNNWLAELGSFAFDYFEFPVFTIWSGTGGFYSSAYDSVIWIMLILNLFLNYLLSVIIWLMLWYIFARFFRRPKVHS